MLNGGLDLFHKWRNKIKMGFGIKTKESES